MKTHTEISILVPVYKVEPYLQRCIDSVLAQDFQDWEMILVDDGSPDRCPAICDEAARKDGRITVVHKENGGLVSARYAGFLRAKAEYLMFLDSDDWLQPNALSLLYAEIVQGYDMVRGNAQRVSPEGEVLSSVSFHFNEGVIESAEDYLVMTYTGKSSPHLWGALYRRSLFSEDLYKVLMEERISFGEDLVTNLMVGQNFKKVLFIPVIVYNYFYNTGSITVTQRVGPEYGKRLEGLLYDRVFSHSKNLQEWQQARHACYCFENCFNPAIGFSKDYDYYKEFLKDERLSRKIKFCTRPRYLFCVRYKSLFRLYSWLYRKVYGLVKQKSTIKQVILN